MFALFPPLFFLFRFCFSLNFKKMEAETGFCYSLSFEEMEKIYNYLKIGYCNVKSNDKHHSCLFGYIKKSFIERYIDEILSDFEKMESIKFMFKQCESKNKGKLELKIIFRELNIVRKQRCYLFFYSKIKKNGSRKWF